MDIVIIGTPFDNGNEIYTVYDPLAPDYQDPVSGTGDWFNDLMDEAGFDDNMYFEEWNDAANTHVILDSWETDSGDVINKGERFVIQVHNHEFTVENTMAESASGETWITQWFYQGEEAGTIVQHSDGTYLTVRATDARGNVWEEHTYTEFKLVNGKLEMR